MSQVKLASNVSLAPYTTLKVGGLARYFVEVRSEEELQAAIKEMAGQSVFILGGGSNVLVNDAGIEGLVIKNSISGVIYEDEVETNVLVTVGAGVIWDELVEETLKRGYWGLENLSSIPGTVGATPVQNVGAYGIEVGELIVSVRVYDPVTDSFKVLNNAECRFGYRDSLFKSADGQHLVVTRVTYRLSRASHPRLHYKDLAERFSNIAAPALFEIRKAILEIRAGKFPDWHVFGTAGSFFKNPLISAEQGKELLLQYPELPLYPQPNGQVKVSLGYILDKICNLRGYREGEVGLFDKQALVLVNYGNASATDIKNFANKISQIVFDKTKIKIEMEVREI